MFAARESVRIFFSLSPAIPLSFLSTFLLLSLCAWRILFAWALVRSNGYFICFLCARRNQRRRWIRIRCGRPELEIANVKECVCDGDDIGQIAATALMHSISPNRLARNRIKSKACTKYAKFEAIRAPTRSLSKIDYPTGARARSC